MMKSERIKQILLGLLGVVAAYVWWGNLEMFIDQSTPYVQSEQIEQADLNGEGSISTLEYKNPRVNPFKRFGVDPEPNSLKPKRALRSVAASLPPVSNRYSVTGILLESDQPQAILNDQAGKTLVVSVGDSLGLWEITTIGKTYLVCVAQTQHDTLWHGTLEIQR